MRRSSVGRAGPTTGARRARAARAARAAARRARRASAGRSPARPASGARRAASAGRAARTPRSRARRAATGTVAPPTLDRGDRRALAHLDRELVREVGVDVEARDRAGTARRRRAARPRARAASSCRAPRLRARCGSAAPSVEADAGHEDVADRRRARSRAATASRPSPASAQRRPASTRRAPRADPAVHPPGVRPRTAPASCARRVDVAGAERQQQVALAQLARAGSARRVEVRQPRHAPPAGGVGGRLGDQPAGDAGEVLGALARRVDVGHDRQVGERERGAELARLVRGCASTGAAGRRRRGGAARASAPPRASPRTSVGWCA